MNRTIIGSILVMVLAVGGIFVLLREGGSPSSSASSGQRNVSMVDGKQVIEITAKGGYAPRVTTARANIPTVINVKTNGTFDCSSALTMPAVGFRKNLPPSGITQIELPPQRSGAMVKGICAMGMYSFAVNFSE